MNLKQIKSAITCGDRVFWCDSQHEVVKTNHGKYLITENIETHGETLPLIGFDGELNGLESEFYIGE